MNLNQAWEAHAKYILFAITKIENIIKLGDIREDEILYDAVLRNLQTLSESTKYLPENKKNLNPEIDWKKINGFRNILVHNYLGDISPKTVLEVIETYLPNLKKAVQKML